MFAFGCCFVCLVYVVDVLCDYCVCLAGFLLVFCGCACLVVLYTVWIVHLA